LTASNAFKPKQQKKMHATPPVFSLEDAKLFEKFSASGGKKVFMDLLKNYSGNQKQMIRDYTGWDLSLNLPKHVSDIEPPTYEAILEYTGERLNEDDLKKERKDKLVEKCKELHVKSSGNKNDLIKRLVSVSNPDKNKNSNEYLEMKISNFLKLKGKESKPPIFQYHKDNFNLLDRYDRYWYDYIYDSERKDMDWENYLMWCLISLGVLNAWVL
jgi:hypothetical protein